MCHTTLEDKIAEVEKRLLEKMDKVGDKVNEVEKSTIWKIKDCEDLLRTRVNEKYVENAIERHLS